MLKLMSMNLYDMEGNSRLENLVAFKKVYAGAIRALTCCLEKFFPAMTVNDIQIFSMLFSPFCSASIRTLPTPTSKGLP